jgi:hypothetical protein
VVARPSEITAFGLADGKPLWGQVLPGTTVPWGLALDRAGRVFAALEGGQVVCFGAPEPAPDRPRASLP